MQMRVQASSRVLMALMFAMSTLCPGSSLTGRPWSAAASVLDGNHHKIQAKDACFTGVPNLVEKVQRGVELFFGELKESFESNRREAMERWHRRQKTLDAITTKKEKSLKKILERTERTEDQSRKSSSTSKQEHSAVAANMQKRNDANDDKLATRAAEDLVETPDSEKKEEYEGYTPEQVRYMKSHYSTIRPSPTLLREGENHKSAEGAEQVPVRLSMKKGGTVGGLLRFIDAIVSREQEQHVDGEDEHVLAPTHEDEVEIAKRRESFRISTRQRKHQLEKSHTH